MDFSCVLSKSGKDGCVVFPILCRYLYTGLSWPGIHSGVAGLRRN